MMKAALRGTGIPALIQWIAAETLQVRVMQNDSQETDYVAYFSSQMFR